MKVGVVRGIPVYIHWSVWLIGAVYLLPTLINSGFNAALFAGLFITGVFASVVAHEFGHALAARYFGLKTIDITLLPIGGLARLKNMSKEPVQELVIALAGPLVNIAIAGVLFLLLLMGVIVQGSAPGMGEAGPKWLLMDQLIVANLFLACFNLLPAFPMDGGRVLRSLLGFKYPYLRSTEIAVKVGRWMALFFAVFAIVQWVPMLLFISLFVFLAGTAELFSVRMQEMSKSGGGFDFGQAASPFGGGGAPNSGAWIETVWHAQRAPFASGQPGQQPRSRPNDGDIIDGEVIDADSVKHIQ